MMYVTLGAIFVAEVVVLAIWGYLTPGIALPDETAGLVLGGTALLVTLGSVVAYKAVFGSLRSVTKGRGAGGLSPVQTSSSVSPKHVPSRSAAMWASGIFVSLLVAGAFFIGDAISGVIALRLGEAGAIQSLVISLVGLSFAVVGSMFLLYRLDLGSGSIRRRVRAFELGWKE
jgi:hypothetical protein